MTTVLALDQAYNCGWAVGSPERPHIASGLVRLERPEEGGSPGPMLLAFHDWLDAMIADHGVRWLFCEALFLAKKGSTPESVLPRAMITGAAKMAAAARTIPVSDVAVYHWRKALLGFGTMPAAARARTSMSSGDWFKAQALRECDRRGWRLTSHEHDEAEACGIRNFGLAQVDAGYRARARQWLEAA